MPPLVPNRLLLRVIHPCWYVKKMPDDSEEAEHLLDLPEAARLKNFAALDDREDFAQWVIADPAFRRALDLAWPVLRPWDVLSSLRAGEIPVQFVTSGPDSAAEAIHRRIHEVCFIARSVNFPVDHAPTFDVAG